MSACVSRALVAGSAFLLMFATSAAAQSSSPTPTSSASTSATQNLIRVFLDCQSCDDVYMRQNVGFVDYVRDRESADVHVLVTTETTGGGGLSWVVKFIGVGRFANRDQTLSFDTPAATTSDERRQAFARIFKLGIVGLAAGTSAGPQLDVTWKAPSSGEIARTADPWRSWVFNLNTNGYLNGERSSSSRSYNVRLSANRTTDRWKINVAANGNLQRNTFLVDDLDPIKSETHSWRLGSQVIKSLGPHWGAGATGFVSHSSFNNVNRAIGAAPAVEFNVFPYSQSSRRSLTVQYAVGATSYRYSEITVFDQMRELVARQAMISQLGLRQPWGSMSVYTSLSQNLDHTDRYRASVYSQADVRLFKGFSFNVFAEYNKINDQISLKKAGASQEDVLLRLRQLATSYSYSLSFGVSYRFGSIFNSVVNSRFSDWSF